MRIPFFSKKSASRALTGAVIKTSRVNPQDAAILRGFSRKMVRMYEAAISTNLNADFPVNITSANAELLTSVSNVRSRGRTIERDNPYGHSIVELYQNNVAGWDPFPLEMKVGKWVGKKFVEEEDTNRLIEEAWKEAGHKENCTVRRDTSRAEMDLQAISAVVRDGGLLFRQYRGFPKNKFNYAVEPIEIDRLDQYFNRPKTGANNEIQFSIELDEYHGPLAYWILTRHPGDVFVSWSGSPRYRERVDAGDVIALFDVRSRAGQHVGISRMASIIRRLHQIDQFDLAHVTAAIWAACKPFFIVQEFPTAMEYVPDWVKNAVQAGTEGNENAEGEKLSTVEPGSGEVLPYGQKPMLVDPKFPVESAAGFKKDSLRAVAAGSGVPYFLLAQDLESVNFSSARIGLDNFHDTCMVLQEHLIENYRRPHFNAWLKYAILSGQLNLPLSRLEEFQKAALFSGRRWDYIQPVQDAQADILLRDAGIKSTDQIIRERGGKGAEHVYAQIASDKELAESHGLDFSQAKKGEPATDGDEPAQGKARNNGHSRFQISG